MQRRTFLLGVGGTALGASALVGSGAFSRAESQRGASIDVAADQNAYVGLDRCEGGANHGFARVDPDSGHLRIDLGRSDDGGFGVNPNSRSWFDGVFQVTNQGKSDAGVKLETVGLDVSAGVELDFYLGENRARSVVSNPFALPLGERECIGIHVNTRHYDGGPASEVVSGELKIVTETDYADAQP